jgi:anaerobic magnesium-protoporphyrin IX monomethyl ester cyclase
VTARKGRRPVVLYQPKDEGVRMPLGLLAVASELPREHVVVVDGRLDLAPEARVVELTRGAECLGVTVRSGRPLRDAVRVSASARRANPGLRVVWGGPHATLRPQQCLATGVVDACVRGAGERAFTEVLQASRSGRSLDDLPGVATPSAPEAEPLSPPPPEEVSPAQYALLELERYFDVRGGRRLDYISGRGRRDGEAGAWWGFPPDRVIAEVGELVDRFRVKTLLFQEKGFFADLARVDALAQGLLEEPRRQSWEVGATPEEILAAGGRRLRLLRGSGCQRVHVLVPPGSVLAGESRRVVLEVGALLHGADLAGRFVLEVDAPRPGHDSLAAADAVARALMALDGRFQTPLQRRRVYPPEEDSAGPFPETVEGWVAREEAPWPDARAERRLRRRIFYFSEAQRPPGRRLGKRLVHALARARVRLGLFVLGFERRVVNASAFLRTGRPRHAGWRD